MRIVGCLLVWLCFAALAAPVQAEEAVSDCSQGAIPQVPAAGSIAGASFKPAAARLWRSGGVTSSDVKFDEYTLELASEEGPTPRAKAQVMFLVPSGKPPDGATIRATSGSLSKQAEVAPGTPQVQGWFLDDDEANVSLSFVFSKGSLRIELGQRSGKSIPVKVHLCVLPGKPEDGKPGTKGSEITGAATAKL